MAEYMTAGQLKLLLVDVPDDVRVLVTGSEGGWSDVEGASTADVVPDRDAGRYVGPYSVAGGMFVQPAGPVFKAILLARRDRDGD